MGQWRKHSHGKGRSRYWSLEYKKDLASQRVEKQGTSELTRTILRAQMPSPLLVALEFLFSGSLHVGRWSAPSGPIGTRSRRVCYPRNPFFPQTVEHGFPNQPSALAFDPELRIMAIGTRSGAVKMYPLLPRCSGIVSTSHVPLTLGWDCSVTGTSWVSCWGFCRGCCACDDSFQKGEGLFVGRWVIAGSVSLQ